MRADEVHGWLLAAGWAPDRVRGSHHMYRHARYARRLCVVVHGRDVPPYRLRRVVSDLTHMGAWAQAEAFAAWAGVRGAHGRRGSQPMGQSSDGQQEGQVTA